MKRLFSPATLQRGAFLHLLGGALVIVGVFFFPMFIIGTRDLGGPNGDVYIYRPYSEWVFVNDSNGNSTGRLLSLLLDAVFVALPLLSLFFVLATSTAGRFREVSSRIGIWRRIAALVGLVTQCLLGFLMYTIGSYSSRVEFGVGFGLVLLGFSVMIVSTFLD